MNLGDILNEINKISQDIGASKVFLFGGTPRDKYMNKVEEVTDIDLTTGDDTIHYIAKEASIKLRGPNTHYKEMEDGHSQLLASTNPAVVAYDPAFAFEVGHIVKDGLRRMYGENSENIFYYLTVYNEPYVQPEESANLDVEGLLKGVYLYSKSAKSGRKKRRANILASGVAMNWALKAQKLLAEDWKVQANVWSVTSWNELRRNGLDVDRHNLLHPLAKKFGLS